MKTSTKISVVVTAFIVISVIAMALKNAAEDVVEKVNERDARISALFERNQ